MTAPATRRVNNGRSHYYYLDGQRAMGVTTAIKKGMPAPALIGWAAREVAEFVRDRRHILTELSDEELVDLCKGAPNRVRDSAARLGVGVHQLAHELASAPEGAVVEVPDLLRGRVDAYLRWWDDWRPEEVITERVVVNRKYRYMGTLDLMCHFPHTAPAMGNCLIDVKTNRSGPFGEAGLQLIAYGRSEATIEPVGRDFIEVPMRHIDTYLVLWLTPDSYEFFPFHVGDREFRQFLYALETARWIEERAQLVKGIPLGRPTRPHLEVVS